MTAFFSRLIILFLVFLRLGLTSFGGPIAHLSYFREEFVEKRKWLTEHAYADLVALCQLLPGPASSQVGISIGLSRAGILGGLISWIAFTLPSALLLVIFALSLRDSDYSLLSSALHGLKIVAVAVVAQAVWNMGQQLCPDRIRITFAVIATIVVSFFPTAFGQVSVIIAGGILGWLLLKKEPVFPHTDWKVGISRCLGSIALILFFGLLILFPLIITLFPHSGLAIFGEFYRAGALVFGGGHVVLPLLQAIVVPSGMVSNDLFLAGYGAAQAIPGPLFSFAAYLGAISTIPPKGFLGALLCLIAIFLPAFLLIVGALPFWETIRRYHAMRRAMQGINAVVVGILLAALFNPVWTSAVFNPIDFCLVLGAFLLLQSWKYPSWLVVILGAGITQLIGYAQSF